MHAYKLTHVHAITHTHTRVQILPFATTLKKEFRELAEGKYLRVNMQLGLGNAQLVDEEEIAKTLHDSKRNDKVYLEQDDNGDLYYVEPSIDGLADKIEWKIQRKI